MKSVELALVIGLALSGYACGGGAITGVVLGGACPAFTPCGGNVVGTWRLQAQCQPADTTSSSCAGQTTTLAPGTNYNATYTFTADGTLSVSFSGTMNATLRYPAECLRSDAGLATACADLQKTMQSTVQATGDAGATSLLKDLSFTCATTSATVCECQESYTYAKLTLNGTYTTSGSRITASINSSSVLPDGGTSDAGPGNAIEYCVSGNTLTIGPGAGTTSGSVVVLIK
jgi:hypothetical protein